MKVYVRSTLYETPKVVFLLSDVFIQFGIRNESSAFVSNFGSSDSQFAQGLESGMEHHRETTLEAIQSMVSLNALISSVFDPQMNFK